MGRMHRARGRAVQVDPMNPTLKALAPQPLKLNYVELLSEFAFYFNLCRYSEVGVLAAHGGIAHSCMWSPDGML
jgi:hypothetical protein